MVANPTYDELLQRVAALEAESGRHGAPGPHEKRFRAMVEKAAVGMALSNSETGEFIVVNERYADIVGYPVEELHALSFQEISHPEDLAEDLRQMDLLQKGEISEYQIEKRYFRKDGRIVWGKLTVSPMWEKGETPNYHIATLEDVTEQKKVQADLKNSLFLLESLDRIDKIIRGGTDAEQVMAQVLDEVLDIFQCDRAWLLYPCDPQAPSWRVPIEKTRPEFPGAFAGDVECPMTEDAAFAMREVLASDDPIHGILKPGEPEYDREDQYGIRAYLISAVYPKVGKPWEFGLHQCAYERKWTGQEVSLFKEISNKIGDALSLLLMLKDLQESEQRYRSIMEASPDPVVTYDMQGRVIYVNPAFTRVFGWTAGELAGKKIDYVPRDAWPETQVMLDRINRGEGFSGFKTQRYDKAGNIIDIDMSFGVWKNRSGDPAGSVIILRDITEQKKVAAQLQRAQKLEAVGTLAGGIAHDFNNILSGIFGYTQLARLHLEDRDRAAKDIDQIQKGGQKAMELVQQILTISRKSPDQKHALAVHVIIKEALKLLRATIPTTIEIRESINTKALVMADAAKIHQVIMNLGTNAYHAMLETGGVMSVGLKEIGFSKPEDAPELSLPPGRYLKLTVSDTGSGMDAGTLAKIFDPYFTTKESGKGTGLGLAVVLGIVEEHNGTIKAYSEPGRGTTFHVYFPVTQKGAAREPEKAPDPAGLSGSERILLVDDDSTVRQATRQLLEEFGFAVQGFSNGKTAFEAFQSDPGRFDLIITDMTMPGMTGFELARAALALRPDQPVILCTGLGQAAIREQAMTIGIRAYIEKPVITREITRVIRSVLDGS